MPFQSQRDLTIRVRVENDGAIRLLDQVEQKLENVGDKARETNREADQLSTTFESIAVTGLKVSGVLTAIGVAAAGAVVSIGRIAERGNELVNAENAFDRLARSAGVASDTLINNLGAAFDGTITRINLLQQANRGLQAGIGGGALVELARGAKAVSDALGENELATFQQFIQAFATGQERIFERSLGLIDVSARIDELAAATGRATQEITEQERISLVQAEVLSRLGGLTEESAEETGNLADVYQKLGVRLSDTFDQFSKIINQSPALIELFEGLLKIVEGLAEAFLKVVGAIDDAINSLNSFARIDTSAITQITQGPPRGRPDPLGILGGLNLPPSPINLNGATSGIVAGIDPKALEQVQQRLGLVAEEVANVCSGLKTTTNDGKKFTKALSDANKIGERFGDEMADLFRRYSDLNSLRGIQGFISNVRSLRQALLDGTITADQYGRELGSIVQEGLAAGLDPAAIGELVAKGFSGVESLGQAKQGLDKFLGKLFDLTDKEAEIASRLTLAFNDIIGKAFAGGFSGNRGEVISSLTDTLASFAGPFAPLVKTLGEAIKKLLGDTENAAEKARKSLDKAFGDILRNNPAVVAIDGIQKAIDDLTIRPAQEEVEKFAQSLNDVEKNAINSVAVALEQLAEEFGVEVNEIRGLLNDALIVNSAGSVLNLRAIIAALGKDIEDLGAALVKSFAVGAISAKELVDLLRGLQTVFSEGIPGALGAVDEAFKQFQALAEKGGTSAIEAIKALAVEALEAGATTFEALANLLTQQYGFNAEEVAALFEALRAAGITTLEQLTQASQEAGIAILNNFQAIQTGVGATITAEQVAALIPKPSASGGGFSSAAREAESAAEATFEAISNTEDYRAAVNSLNANLLTNAQFQKIVNGLILNYNDLIARREDIEERINKIIQNGGKLTAEQIKQFEKLNNQLEAFGSDSKNGVVEVNKAFVKFFDEFKDDANALQLAMEAAGLSAEQTADGITALFKAGKISASEALAEYRRFEDGLGDSSATAAEAFANFLGGGTSGGAFTIDALKDIAAEALRAGGDTLSDLENQFLDSGLGRGRIAPFFKALQDQGIESLEQLANVSDEVATKIIGRAEEFGAPFQQTSRDIETLLKRLEKIRTSAPIKLKIGADLDPELRELLDLYRGNARPRRNSNPGQGRNL